MARPEGARVARPAAWAGGGGSELGAAALRAALWLLLGGWVGSWVCFAMLVAPAAFRVLPTRLAGELVSPVLGGLHLAGAGAGVALALLAGVLRRGRVALALPLLLSALCLASHFGVTPAVAELRAATFGGAGSEEIAARFQRLHSISMLLFGAVLAGTLVLVGLHARADVRGRRS
jgi:hypothetical protein